MKLYLLFAVILTATFTLPCLAQSFPKGSETTHVWDYAKVLSKSDKGALRERTRKFEKKHGSGIWIITVPNLEKYDADPENIEGYAQLLLNEKLAAMGSNEASVLILLSKGDRKARIELGPEWGLEWDVECEHIMQIGGVPKFRKKDYGLGLITIMSSLDRLATERENTGPVHRFLANMGARIGPYSPFPPIAVIPTLAFSLLLFVLGLYAKGPEGKKDGAPIKWLAATIAFVTLFTGGIYHFITSIEIPGEFMFFALIIVLFIISNWVSPRGGGSGWGSDYGSSSFLDFGGGGGGGFDFGGGGGGFDFGGGGGATGSW